MSPRDQQPPRKRSSSAPRSDKSQRSSKPARPGSSPEARPGRGYQGKGSSSKPRQPRRARKIDGHVPEEFKDASRGIRLQKILAEKGLASRRDSEKLIAEGHVKVNGKLVTGLPAWVDPMQDRVEVDGEVLTSPRSARKHTVGPKFAYVLFNKPRGVVTTTRDPEGRATVLDYIQLPAPLPQRVFPVGRLDADSTGLLLLTNDGELANRLTHPRYQVPKQYRVLIRGKLTIEDIEKLKRGLYLAHRKGPGGKTAAAPAANMDDDLDPDLQPAPDVDVKKAHIESAKILGYQQDRERGDRTVVLITLREGQNREIRRLLAKVGFNVRRLERVAIGPLHLKGLAMGQWRLLNGAEIRRLREVAGLADGV